MNMANDARFLRINLHNGAFKLRLTDPRGTVVDVAGDGAGPFAGGRECSDGQAQCDARLQKVYSMERVHPVEPGDTARAWKRCTDPTAAQKQHIRANNQRVIEATPGQPNSGQSGFPAEDPRWRIPQ